MTTNQPSEYVETTTQEATNKMGDFNAQKGGVLAPMRANTQQTSEQWREWGKQVSSILSELPDYIGKFVIDNQRPIITLGLIFTAIVALKLTLAVLDAVNDIPLLAPTFELVGIGYTIWFVYRYLLQSSTRQELRDEINNFKKQVVGHDSQKS